MIFNFQLRRHSSTSELKIQIISPSIKSFGSLATCQILDVQQICKLFFGILFLEPNILETQYFLGLNIFWRPYFWGTKYFGRPNICGDQTILGHLIFFGTKYFWRPNIFWTEYFLENKYLLRQIQETFCPCLSQNRLGPVRAAHNTPAPFSVTAPAPVS